jgi:D-sedoheptulose 7-phosphate isomerase
MSDAREVVAASLREGVAVGQAMLDTLVTDVALAGEWLVETLREENKLLLFGNGGSAADAQHIAAELVGQFRRPRRPLAALALTTDTSVLTALSNDLGVECVFARQVEALGRPGDLALALSTSGSSPNVLAGVRAARERGLRTVGFTGWRGDQLVGACDLTLQVPSANTAHIQEGHIAIGHALCELVDVALA